ncbi:hypothetical protein FsymDg_0825 [Candidatus Protofrankia datiscae]|uniref:Uncharacterized protein n=1 Tax=Candidatus Protofrankia datiscae TaxID=2716812 RepID=F8AWD6_9ACTN|nr:hypothetical protein FsymDg_0825 [Candidatus Protofrankia datiscae]
MHIVGCGNAGATRQRSTRAAVRAVEDPPEAAWPNGGQPVAVVILVPTIGITAPGRTADAARALLSPAPTRVLSGARTRRMSAVRVRPARYEDPPTPTQLGLPTPGLPGYKNIIIIILLAEIARARYLEHVIQMVGRHRLQRTPRVTVKFVTGISSGPECKIRTTHCRHPDTRHADTRGICAGIRGRRQPGRPGPLPSVLPVGTPCEHFATLSYLNCAEQYRCHNSSRSRFTFRTSATQK